MTAQALCKRILVVEDEPAIQEALQEILPVLGYQPIFAENGEVALEVLRASVNDICLILLDLFMPVMDGWQFLECVKGKPVPPIVVMSAGGPVARETASGLQGYLPKPIELDQLLAIAARFCGPERRP